MNFIEKISSFRLFRQFLTNLQSNTHNKVDYTNDIFDLIKSRTQKPTQLILNFHHAMSMFSLKFSIFFTLNFFFNIQSKNFSFDTFSIEDCSNWKVCQFKTYNRIKFIFFRELEIFFMMIEIGIKLLMIQSLKLKAFSSFYRRQIPQGSRCE